MLLKGININILYTIMLSASVSSLMVGKGINVTMIGVHLHKISLASLVQVSKPGIQPSHLALRNCRFKEWKHIKTRPVIEILVQ